jgi:hypothetical protein
LNSSWRLAKRRRSQVGRRARYKRRRPRPHNLCLSSIPNSQLTPAFLTTSRVAAVSATTRHPPQTSPTPHALHSPHFLHACCVGLRGPHSPNGAHPHRRCLAFPRQWTLLCRHCQWSVKWVMREDVLRAVEADTAFRMSTEGERTLQVRHALRACATVPRLVFYQSSIRLRTLDLQIQTLMRSANMPRGTRVGYLDGARSTADR